VWLCLMTHTLPFSPTHPYSRRETGATQNTNRNRTTLAEGSQEDESVVKETENGKVGDKIQGGGSEKQTFGENNFEKTRMKMVGATVE
jgi:hypothetical protein